jgi:hypothetical protein
MSTPTNDGYNHSLGKHNKGTGVKPMQTFPPKDNFPKVQVGKKPVTKVDLKSPMETPNGSDDMIKKDIGQMNPLYERDPNVKK